MTSHELDPTAAPVNEEWRPVARYEGLYEVSSLGRVRSLDITVRNSAMGVRLRKGRLLRTKIPRHGYQMVSLSKNSVVTGHLVHRLVAAAFCPTPSIPNATVNHLNSDRMDNRATNLEWCSQSANLRHAGPMMMRADKTKLTPAEVTEIRRRLALGQTHKEVAEDCGIARQTVTKINNAQRWKHLR